MSFSWSVWWCFSEKDGITLCTRQGHEIVETQHFSTVRPLLKHLRETNPHHEFKSEVWNYYGKNYTIKGRFK